MKTINIVLIILTILSVVLVGYYLMITIDEEVIEWMEEHPGETLEVGGPPNILLMAAVIFPMAVVMLLLIKWMDYVNRKDPMEENETYNDE